MTLTERIADQMDQESKAADLRQLNQQIARTDEQCRRLRAKRDHAADEITARHDPIDPTDQLINSVLSAPSIPQPSIDDIGSQHSGDRWDSLN
jgi:septal ring factor EnvC (AmiA/AmiB activator)